MKKVKIYTDGACSGNPGKGGWAAILIYNAHEKEIFGSDEHTTNNRMEITAALKGLMALKEPCEVELYSDSAYLVDSFNLGWIEKWKSNGWRKSNNEEVKNQDLWEQLLHMCSIHKVKWIKVKGHADNEYNNRCDKLATGQISK